MKKIYILLSLFCMLLGEFSMAQKRDVRFFLVHKFVGPDENQKSVEGLDNQFYTYFKNKIEETFPCASVNSDKNIRGLLEQERQKQLEGNYSDENMKNIADAYNIDFLVSLELGTIIGNQFSVSVVCIPYRTKEKFPIARAYARCPFNKTQSSEMTKKIEEVGKEIIEKLKKKRFVHSKGLYLLRIVLLSTQLKNINTQCIAMNLICN